jgi:hypothetical protein
MIVILTAKKCNDSGHSMQLMFMVIVIRGACSKAIQISYYHRSSSTPTPPSSTPHPTNPTTLPCYVSGKADSGGNEVSGCVNNVSA